MNRQAPGVPLPGITATFGLLLLTAFLLVMQGRYDNPALWILFAVSGFATFVVGVVTAATALRAQATAAADAARLDDLEPLPPVPGDEEGRR
jgi:hypothetical protein